MKLWLLRPTGPNSEDGEWKYPYDMKHGFIVRAGSETEARQIAASNAWDEGPDAWLSTEHSTCTELVPEGEPGLIMEDKHPG